MAPGAGTGSLWSSRSWSCLKAIAAPGSVYDEPRHVRVGFGRVNMHEALDRLERHLEVVG